MAQSQMRSKKLPRHEAMILLLPQLSFTSRSLFLIANHFLSSNISTAIFTEHFAYWLFIPGCFLKSCTAIISGLQYDVKYGE